MGERNLLNFVHSQKVPKLNDDDNQKTKGANQRSREEWGEKKTDGEQDRAMRGKRQRQKAVYNGYSKD